MTDLESPIHAINFGPAISAFNPVMWLTPEAYRIGTLSPAAFIGHSFTGAGGRGEGVGTTPSSPQTYRCDCAECLELDQLPDLLAGWPGAYQLALIGAPSLS